MTYGLYIVKAKGPTVIIDKNGIWIKYYNFIPWNNIEECNPYIMFGTTEGIGLRIKNIQEAIENAERSGKLGLFWAKLFKRYYQITLSNLDISNDEILHFTKQYVDSSNNQRF